MKVGCGVDISGNYAVAGEVGSSYDSGGTNYLLVAGAAYFYKQDSLGEWQETQKVVPSDRGVDSLANFGSAVAMHGKYAAVGAWQKRNPLITDGYGAVYIYERDSNEVWQEIQKLMPGDSMIGTFGFSMDMYGDQLIVGCISSNAVQIYQRDSATHQYVLQFTDQMTTSQNGGEFGVSCSIEENVAVVGAWENSYDAQGSGFLVRAGAAYVYRKNSAGVWSRVQKITANDRLADGGFGYSCKAYKGEVYVGAMVLNDAVYYFTDSLGVWVQKQKIQGSSVSPPYFGYDMDIANDMMVVGARDDNYDENEENFLQDAGSAYIFKYENNVWQQVQKIVAYDRQQGDFYGQSVAISGDDIMVGAPRHDWDSVGGNYVFNAGAVYFYETTFPLLLEICEGDSALVFGSYQDTTGYYYDTLPNASSFGGDSMAITYVSVYPTKDTTINLTGCDSIIYKGVTYYADQLMIDTLSTSHGCDSVVSSTLQVHYASTTLIDTTIYKGSVIVVGGTSHGTSGQYSDSLQTVENCDSIITYVLTVLDTTDGVGSHLTPLLQVYPNPFDATLTLKMDENAGSSHQVFSVRMLDILGQEVLHLQHPIANGSLQIDTQGLEKGLYLLEVQDVGRIKVVKR